MAISKIILNGVTQMDVTQDTVASSNLLSGYTATKNDGTKVSGSYVPPSAPTLQTKTKTYTPTTSQQTETITADNGYDGLEEVDITVNAVPMAVNTESGVEFEYYTENNQRKVRLIPWYAFTGGYINTGDYDGVESNSFTAIPTGTTITPTESSQTIGGANYMMEGAVTVNAIPSNYVGSGITQRSSSDLSASGATVTVPSGYYSAQASKSVASGTAGTPTATKGTVSNHSVSVTPSVTNTTGYITGGTKTGTAVSVSASELVSGSETKTQNGTYDVTNLAELVVNVQGGGTSGVQVAVATPQSGANTYVMFGNLLGAPTSFSLINAHDIAIGTDPIVSALTYDGTDYVGQTVTNTSNANASYVSAGFSHSYDSQYGQIMISNANVKFDTHSNYTLIYTYGGSASDIQTADVQVGSGATSITFPVNGRPTYWSCVFKSNFGTSSGYQRVIAATEYNSSIGGLCLDSSAHFSDTYWTASYSGGNLTISSQGTNAGGYFHQPGYYQLTYIVDESAPSYETVSKTYRASTSAQSEKIEPSTGYDAMSEVNISIPAVTQTNLVAGNIKSGTTISISNGSTNLWSVTGTYTGGGSSTCDTKTITNSDDQATSIQFTGLSGQPKWFFVRCTSQLTRSSSYSYYYVTAVRYNGTNHYGNYYRRSNGTFYNDTTHYSHTYSNGTLTVSSSANRGAAGGSFYNGGYELVYVY